MAKDRESGCDPLRPEQKISDEQMKEIDGALSGSALGLGRVSSEVSTHTASTVNNQVLTADALAQAWFIYQACVLKDAGMIDDALVDSIMRQRG